MALLVGRLHAESVTMESDGLFSPKRQSPDGIACSLRLPEEEAPPRSFFGRDILRGSFFPLSFHSKRNRNAKTDIRDMLGFLPQIQFIAGHAAEIQST